MRDFKNGEKKSNFAKHLVHNCNIMGPIEDMDILHMTKKSCTREHTGEVSYTYIYTHIYIHTNKPKRIIKLMTEAPLQET
jgi:hypothetical protein